MNRRHFVKTTASTLVATSAGFSAISQKPPERKFKIALNPGIIGVKANLNEAIDYAIKYGYEAVSPYVNEVMKMSDAQIADVVAKAKSHNLGWDSTNIPVEYRQSKTRFNDEFKELKKFVQAMEKMGATRINTWIISSHNELTYNENMKQTAYRLSECAKVMKDHGVRLGLEYLGMRTLMTQFRYPFIGSLKEGKELIAEIGESNVGFVLDSFHWYCADDTIDDIRTLKPEDVVVVDINDARSGFTRVEQQDGKRELPMATGVIKIKDFMQALIDIGYDGPIRTEPFNQVLNDMEDTKALQINMDAIRKTLATVGY
ncbi:MAG: sugar phosphate isomerase/epimerase family protein [Spirosomataceae bacterium]